MAVDRAERVSIGRTDREVLAACREVLEPALHAAIDSLPGSMRLVAGYHFGWCDEAGLPIQAAAGKAIRPTLALVTADAVGDRPQDAVPGAVAIELVHNFSLLHDDVFDGDLTRRHRPTAWSVFGVGSAIMAGDSLLTLAFDLIARSGHACAPQATAALAAAVQAMIDGQAKDVGFQDRCNVDLLECMGMAKGKTGALMACACELGALFGGADSGVVARMRGFGGHIGLAFQFIDDLLGIWGDPALTGKSIYSDLQTRKKSLPVVAALTSGDPAGAALEELYRSSDPLSEEDLARAAELIHSAGAHAWSQAQADELFGEALELLACDRLNQRAADELAALGRFIVGRNH